MALAGVQQVQPEQEPDGAKEEHQRNKDLQTAWLGYGLGHEVLQVTSYQEALLTTNLHP